MKRIRIDKRNEEGMALLVATIFILVALIALAALSHRVLSQSHRVDSHIQLKECLQGLEFALAESKAELEGGWNGHIGLDGWEFSGEWNPAEEPFPAPGFEDSGVVPEAIATMNRVEYLAYAHSWADDGLDNNGDGVIDEPDEEFMHTVYAFARNTAGSVHRAAEIVVGGTDVNVWRNAVFAGAGQAGGSISGNVSIHGSVHILGDNIAEGAEAIVVLDMEGTSLIHNNYDVGAGLGPGQAIFDRCPPLPTTSFEGEDGIETLFAKLRVKNGVVSINSTSEVGAPDVKGNGFKETMDGVFVEDGWTGNKVVDDGDRGDPTEVYSDNGWDEGYDLGERVELPLFDSEYRDMEGNTVPNPDTGANYTHYEYFHDQLTGTPYEGDVYIEQGKGDFYYNATRPDDPDPANRQPDDDFIYYDDTTGRLWQNGQVEINGNFTMTGKPGKVAPTVDYTGRVALLVHGNVQLDCNLLSMNEDGTTDRSFPEKNVFGIMGEKDMSIGNIAQQDLMGAFYAQGSIISSKQTRVMGSFVANFFDLGNQVPDIYQVPALAENLPMGMIGAYPLIFYDNISWREIEYEHEEPSA